MILDNLIWSIIVGVAGCALYGYIKFNLVSDLREYDYRTRNDYANYTFYNSVEYGMIAALLLFLSNLGN